MLDRPGEQDPGQPNPEFARPADRARLERAAAALARRGFTAPIADSAKEARRLVLEAIPEGAEVHIALSETMHELGLTREIDESILAKTLIIHHEPTSRITVILVPETLGF